jgi:hypothetical protein
MYYYAYYDNMKALLDFRIVNFFEVLGQQNRRSCPLSLEEIFGLTLPPVTFRAVEHSIRPSHSSSPCINISVN